MIKKPSESSNAKTLKKHELNVWDIKYYHGSKVIVNNARKNITVSRKHKIIEINSEFWDKLTNSQRAFLLRWARGYIKFNDQFRADKYAFNYIRSQGLSEIEAYNLFETCKFFSSRDKRERALNLASMNIFEYFMLSAKKWIRGIFSRKAI